MPIDTRLDGRPEQVHATARWLRDQLAFEVGAGVAAMNSARSSAAGGWLGAAGTAFQDRMATNATAAGELRAGIERTANNLTEYANQLAVAQQHMANAREIAANGGLAVDGFMIGEPGTVPTAPDAAATPAILTAHTDAVAAHQRQVDAYILAEGEARKGNAGVRFLADVGKNIYDDVTQKWFFASGDMTNGVYGGFLKQHIDILNKNAAATLEQVKKLEGHYLKSQGGSPHSKSLVKLLSEQTLEAKAAEARATSLSMRFAKKVPLIGYAITAAGVGYDIQHGKPAVKAIASGVASIGGSILGGMAAGGLAGTMGAGPVGTVVGVAVGGVVGGLVGSGITDAVYDRLPEGVKDAFNDGQAVVGRAVGEVGDDAQKLWNKIF
ncbi:hypothetical protein QLQ12_15230 [Actinoplanes sp. NEAU-A12]|uniref:WXG100 family type VII secretion target n=1 Tax=Actinoplanes sandaracinus TaxID=3045177 RepID=A0ABT6WJQ1_9ACTN|nr:hypothetical protein [Actinoplanes sandaracinus]MDI6099952.1 hypothetical protein [Actinoplanes sandaracinus]